jgi:hypothetical protein
MQGGNEKSKFSTCNHTTEGWVTIDSLKEEMNVIGNDFRKRATPIQKKERKTKRKGVTPRRVRDK